VYLPKGLTRLERLCILYPPSGQASEPLPAQSRGRRRTGLMRLLFLGSTRLEIFRRLSGRTAKLGESYRGDGAMDGRRVS
ncbi:MAG: hypothetical protein N2512_02135, partial [Armatimonadetes bacterium]|nr:hypothetical protein [Armatimonadota bacterium]